MKKQLPNAKHKLQADPRLRFNWGYHDGAGDVQHRRRVRSMTDHYGKIYAQGYEFGTEDAKNDAYTGDSEAAWKSRTSLRQAPWMPRRHR